MMAIVCVVSKPCQYVSVRMASSDTLNQIANGEPQSVLSV